MARPKAPITIPAAAPVPMPPTVANVPPPAVVPPATVPPATVVPATVVPATVPVVAVVAVTTDFIPSFVSIVPAVFFPKILINNLGSALTNPRLKILINPVPQSMRLLPNCPLNAIIAKVRAITPFITFLIAPVTLSNTFNPASPNKSPTVPLNPSNIL